MTGEYPSIKTIPPERDCFFFRFASFTGSLQPIAIVNLLKGSLSDKIIYLIRVFKSSVLFMKITVGINNRTAGFVDEKMVRKAVKAVLEGEVGDIEDRNFELSIAFIGPKKIRELNKQYRKINEATDILSFSEADSAKKSRGKSVPENGFLGEMVICLKQVRENAKSDGKSLKEELTWVVIHGVLHLLGYDHEKNEAEAALMRKKEKFYLSKLTLV